MKGGLFMGNYVGKHLAGTDAESLYDRMYEELFGAENRMRKFERTHYVRNDGSHIKKDARKCYRSRKVCYFDRDLDDRPDYRKVANIAESVAVDDYNAEIYPHEHYVGKTTLTKKINRKYAEMQKIAEDFRKQNGYRIGTDLWAYDSHYYHVDYPNEYYRLRSEYLALDAERDEKFRMKLERGITEEYSYECFVDFDDDEEFFAEIDDADEMRKLNEWLKYA